MKKQTDDYDSPWKEIVELYFQSFIEFFFPQAADDIDWSRGYEFLDKELRQITKDAETGRKYVDKLVKVWLKSGEDLWVNIHADIQTQHEKDFGKRMYTYNYRLFDRFGHHAASFAVLGDAGKKWKSGSFEQKQWGCKVKFEFPVVKLAGYARRWGMLEKSKNPFAVVVMAHLLTQKTAKYPKRRQHEKFALIRHLYKKGFLKQDIINLFRFIDWIMDLPEKEEKLFWQELEEYEKEEKMKYITSVERIGYQRGVQEGELRLIARQIARRFASKPEKELKRLKKISAETLTEFGEKIFDFQSLKEVHEWIKNASSTAAEASHELSEFG